MGSYQVGTHFRGLCRPHVTPLHLHEKCSGRLVGQQGQIVSPKPRSPQDFGEKDTGHGVSKDMGCCFWVGNSGFANNNKELSSLNARMQLIPSQIWVPLCTLQPIVPLK